MVLDLFIDLGLSDACGPVPINHTYTKILWAVLPQTKEKERSKLSIAPLKEWPHDVNVGNPYINIKDQLKPLINKIGGV